MIWILKVSLFRLDVFESRKLWKILWSWEKYNFNKDWKKDRLEGESL